MIIKLAAFRGRTSGLSPIIHSSRCVMEIEEFSDAVRGYLGFDTNIEIVTRDESTVIVSKTGAMIHKKSLAAFDLRVVIWIKSISGVKCWRDAETNNPTIRVWIDPSTPIPEPDSKSVGAMLMIGFA